MTERPPFMWKGEQIDTTIRSLLDAVCAVADEAEAAEFMAAYRAVNPAADANIGYIIGYLDPVTRGELYGRFNLSHPTLGGRP